MEPGGSLPHSQEPATCPYTEPATCNTLPKSGYKQIRAQPKNNGLSR
jgi:hypothetical protein